MTRLPDELLKHVLDELQPNPDEPISVISRRFLSQESLDSASPSPRSCVENIKKFRYVCKQFAAVGAPLLFSRVVIRLCKRDLERLEGLAEWPVATCVKRFSYLVPYSFEPLSSSRARNHFPRLELTGLQQKEDERRQILATGEDVRVLTKAIKAFTKLQHVRILPLADEEQNTLLRLMRQEPALSAYELPSSMGWNSETFEGRTKTWAIYLIAAAELGLMERAETLAFLSSSISGNRRAHLKSLQVKLDWKSACYHCSRTVGNALLDAKVQAIRFSYPKIKPEDAFYFASQKLQSISNVAATLTSLTLQFEEVIGLESEVYTLAPLFRTAFSRAENLEAIHVGFMSPRPLDVQLEDVFQNITWPKLVALGIHGWSLNGQEILNLALRHRAKLKGLRLRNISLREGSTWKHVLGQLRQQMLNLTWISLTGAAYMHLAPSGAEELDGGASDVDSDSESEEGEHESPQRSAANADPWISNRVPGLLGPSSLSDEEFYGVTDSEDEIEPPTAEIEDLDLNGNQGQRYSPSVLRCICSELDMPFRETLEGHDAPVPSGTAKQWERWVVNCCPRHGRR